MKFRAYDSVAATLSLACLLTAALLAGGCGKREEPVSQEPPKPAAEPAPEPEPEPEPEPISMASLEPLTLKPAESATIEIQVERNGNEGPIKVEAVDSPDGITVAPVEIPAEESTGEIKVTAAQKLGNEEFSATFPIKATLGEVETSERLVVTVHKLKLPSFESADSVLLQPGTAGSTTLALSRNGFEGPLPLRVEGVPEKVKATVLEVEAGSGATTLEITAAGDAPDGQHEIQVAGTILGRNISVKVPVKIEKTPFQVKSFKTVTISPGEENLIEIPIERKSYDGPITLEVAELPEGVTVPKTDVAPGATKALLDFKVAPDARECVRTVRVVAKAGKLGQNTPLILRTSYGGQGFLPRAITANEELFHLLRRGSFGGRLTAESKQALVDAYGGTTESEEAVLKGLRWLIAHQQPDGRWPLKDYSEGIEGCDCPIEFEAEVLEYDSAGTAFGLLPLLGAGVTHNRAPDSPPELRGYRENVEKGLAFLIQNQVHDRDSDNDGYLGGNMYAHALGTMALCEAYGLSGDEKLKVPAQLAIKYLKDAQHTEGGWRYGRNQPGDMSVTSWVFLAIRSGQLAGLMIDRAPLTRAERFVDSCATGPEEAKFSRYAYQPDGDTKLSLSAAGLLTRLYIGWRKDEPDLQAGVNYLMENLPPTSGGLGQIYYHHYATQVLHHMEGADFDLWNYRMREHLLRTQEKSGHKAGSWSPQGSDWGARGGRMYATAMALLTLQVYYRHLPMFRPVIRVPSQTLGASQ